MTPLTCSALRALHSPQAARDCRSAEAALELLTHLARSSLLDTALSLDALQHCCFILSIKREPALEEARIAAVRCIQVIVHQSSLCDSLREEESAPLLGHTLSLLLDVALQEALAGDRGSRTLRGDALGTLRQVLLAVCLAHMS
jgi:hypothetical protein